MVLGGCPPKFAEHALVDNAPQLQDDRYKRGQDKMGGEYLEEIEEQRHDFER